MDWKEFLKLSKPKTISFIILLALIVIYTMFADTNVSCIVDEGASFCYGIPSLVSILLFWPINLAVLLLSKLGTLTANVGFMIYVKLFFRILILILGIVLNLVYVYVISILILKLIEKLKKTVLEILSIKKSIFPFN